MNNYDVQQEYTTKLSQILGINPLEKLSSKVAEMIGPTGQFGVFLSESIITKLGQPSVSERLKNNGTPVNGEPLCYQVILTSSRPDLVADIYVWKYNPAQPDLQSKTASRQHLGAINSNGEIVPADKLRYSEFTRVLQIALPQLQP